MNVEKLKQDNVFSHFYNICQIPHASGKEKAISQYLYQWARNLGYEAVTDAADNVLIKVPASNGYENKPAVMLQSHMDMVCEKIPESQHDFSKDPIPWVVEGDLLTTGGETTLGADNGIGIALTMALLEDPTWNHPALEVLFTTNEEEDFTGASTFDASQMNSSYLINLDQVREGETICGSCGGMRVDMKIPLSMKPVDEDCAFYRITIGGLRGGHSGEDIHLGRGNANVFMGRIFQRLQKELDFSVISIKGGSFRLAIPREASFVIALKRKESKKMIKTLNELEDIFQKELSVTGEALFIYCKEIEKNWEMDGQYASGVGADPKKISTVIALIPDGIHQMNESFEGIVDTSDNLGEIYLEKNQLHMILEIRSATESLRTYLYDKMEMVADLFGGECFWADAYPSWDFHAGSPLQKLCQEIYREQTGNEMRFLTVHAGLEVGYFLGKKHDIDAVSIGPDIWDFHSPSERVSISSTKRVYTYLKMLLERM